MRKNAYPAKTGGSKELEHLPRKRGKRQPPGRGHYEKDSPAIIAWVSRTGYTMLKVVRDFTIETAQKAANIAVKTGSVIYTDSAKSYAALVGYIHDSVNHSQREYARGEVHENRAENTFLQLVLMLRPGRRCREIIEHPDPSIPGILLGRQHVDVPHDVSVT
jgi:hypothetical protein